MTGRTALIVLGLGAAALFVYFLATGYEETRVQLAQTQLAIAQQNTATANAHHASTGDVILGIGADVGKLAGALFAL